MTGGSISADRQLDERANPNDRRHATSASRAGGASPAQDQAAPDRAAPDHAAPDHATQDPAAPDPAAPDHASPDDLLARAADPTRPPRAATFVVTGVAFGGAMASQPLLGTAWAAGLLGLVLLGVLGAEHRRHHHLGVPRVQQLPAEVTRPQRAWLLVTVLAVVIPATTLGLGDGPGDGLDPGVGPVVAGLCGAVAIAVGGPVADRRMRRAAAVARQEQHDAEGQSSPRTTSS